MWYAYGNSRGTEKVTAIVSLCMFSFKILYPLNNMTAQKKYCFFGIPLFVCLPVCLLFVVHLSSFAFITSFAQCIKQGLEKCTSRVHKAET